MTVDSKLSKVVYQGNGVTTEFPFHFNVFKCDWLTVTISNSQGASEIVTVLEENITISESGGTVEFYYYPNPVDNPLEKIPLPSGFSLSITRNMSFLQMISLENGAAFLAKVIENSLDIATAERQQLLEMLSRSVILPPTSDESPSDMLNRIFEAARSALKSANHSNLFAKGTDEEIISIGFTGRSSKGYAENSSFFSNGSVAQVIALGGDYSSKDWAIADIEINTEGSSKYYAEGSALSAQNSETSAINSEEFSEFSETQATKSEAKAGLAEESSIASQESAEASASSATASAQSVSETLTNATNSATSASESLTSARASATSAAESLTSATASASSAAESLTSATASASSTGENLASATASATSASESSTSATASEDSALLSENWAISDIEYNAEGSAKYWALQASQAVPDATSSIKGKAAFATEAEVLAGIILNKTVTPKSFNSGVFAHNADEDAHIHAFAKHNTDGNAHGNLLISINPIDLFRYGEIGHPRIGHTMNDTHYIPADGRIVNLANYPELLAKILDDKIDSRSSYSTSYPGVWSLSSGTSYRSPDMQAHFVRFSTTSVGLKENDAIRNITGTSGGIFLSSYSPGGTGAMFKYAKDHGGGSAGNGGAATSISIDTSRLVPTASENRPNNIYQSPVIYLGRLATEMSSSETSTNTE